MLMMFLMIVAVDTWVWFPFWLGIGAIFILERIVTVWRAGWWPRFVAALLFPELLYDMFLSLVFVIGLAQITLGRRARWGHVPRESALGEGVR